MTQSIRTNKSSGLMRKLNKLKTKPKHFIVDSKGYRLAQRSWKQSLKLGSFSGWWSALRLLRFIFVLLFPIDM